MTNAFGSEVGRLYEKTRSSMVEQQPMALSVTGSSPVDSLNIFKAQSSDSKVNTLERLTPKAQSWMKSTIHLVGAEMCQTSTSH